ncbi:MAG: hypothetical protein AB7E30_09215 [Lawsonibacter sp.]
MRNSRWFLAAVLLAALLTTGLTGCGGREKPSADGGAAASERQSAQDGSDAPNAGEEQPEGDRAATGYPIADSYTAYVDAKTTMTSKMIDGLSGNPDTALASLGLLGGVMVDMVMLPVSFFGMDQEAAATGLAFMNASGVEYEENADGYAIRYTDAQGRACVFEGTYDEAADALACKATNDGADSLYGEYQKTPFGYVGQYYIRNDDGTVLIYRISIQGEDGVFGISGADRYTPLTGAETVDFPKECEEWYAVSRNAITGVMADGTQVDVELAA